MRYPEFAVLDEAVRRRIGENNVWDIEIKHFNVDGEFVFGSIVRLVNDPLGYLDKKVYEHPSEWFEYCRKCGQVDEEAAYANKVPPKPVGIYWKRQGWSCAQCKGDIWWVKEELKVAVFNRDVPRYYLSKRFTEDPPWVEDRLYLRLVSTCLMCNAEMYDDGSKWDCMICPKCVMPLVQRIVGTLTVRWRFPFYWAVRVAAFIMARRSTPVEPRFPVYKS